MCAARNGGLHDALPVLRTVVFSASYRAVLLFYFFRIVFEPSRLLLGRRAENSDGDFLILHRVLYFRAAFGTFHLRCGPRP